ncbi:13496_t:CDS:10 [Cetraspora pellucida]|uniref:13496_t:CDS:1 n=1 Tax=Cetraspora pellucida TaxID=1433469 RepID=A0A9N9A3Y9_9GLOM|nr:13496_t:CDS:10 [Cetraspora pellucida]
MDINTLINFEPDDELFSDSIIKDLSSEDNVSISDFQNEIDVFEESINKYDNHLSTSQMNQEIYMITEQLRVKEIIHTVLSMEYPPISEDRIAIIYNIETWNSFEAYKLGKPCGGGDAIIYCSFLEISVKRSYYTCQGIKVCENLDPNIKNKFHSEVDMDNDLVQKYLALHNTDLVCPFNNENCNGNLVVKKLSKLNQNSNEVWFIGCSRWKSKESHLFHRLKDEIDSYLLKKLLDEELNLQSSEDNLCNIIFSSNSRRKLCGFLHKNSDNSFQEGKIIKMNCGVKFHKIIPFDLKKTPYIILVCKGIHSHPPPPPQEVPLDIMNKLKTLIKSSSEQFVDITVRKLISNNLIKAVFGKDYLSEVHASLNNMDKLRRLVAKVQKSKHPYGQGILGLTYNIWSAAFGNRHIMVIFQGDINEFEINCYDKNYKITLTYARVFTNIMNTNAYEQMFQAFFNWIYNLTNENPKFYHIHKEGWKCIIGDLDQAQAKGLGIALNKLEKSLNWEEHLLHIFKIKSKGKSKQVTILPTEEKKVKKQNIEIDLTEDSSSKFVNEKEYELALKERELAIREKELQLERESLELAKLRRELSLNKLND